AGDGPKPLSLAPMRARNGRPRARSCASGPTKGTVAGNRAASAVSAGRAAIMVRRASTLAGAGTRRTDAIEPISRLRKRFQCAAGAGELAQHVDFERGGVVVAGVGARGGAGDDDAGLRVDPQPLAMD